MPGKNRSRRLQAALLLLIAGLLVSSCTTVSVVNNSKQNVQVTMWLPFDEAKVTILPPGGEMFEIGAIGGDFDIHAESGTELVDALTALKDKLEADLKQPNIDAAEVLTLLDELHTAITLVETAKANKSISYCADFVPDFGSVGGTIVDTGDGGVKFDSCVVNSPKLEDTTAQ